MRPEVLFINPWIYDFAAFDLWARPLGLLYLAARFRSHGFNVRLVDCLDRLHPRSGAPRPRKAHPPGTGPWARTPVETPVPYQGAPRRYCRYGMPEDAFFSEISAGPRPDLIMVGSGMTYWYQGVVRAVALARKAWPEARIVLGGNYPSLYPEHAREHAGADLVISGPGEETADRLAAEFGLESSDNLDFFHPWPALDLYPRLAAAPLLTSRGCPLRCPYCASGRLFPALVTRDPDNVLAEIEDRRLNLNLTDFAFFDDALLFDAQARLIPILEEVVRRGWKIRFHAPNGLHVGSITPELARLMKAAGFYTLRLGVESLDPERRERLGGKVPPGGFDAAAQNLLQAGFPPERIGVYILWGLPGQPLDEVLTTAKRVAATGLKASLAEYSPLPGTPLWAEAIKTSPFDLAEEPLYGNNTFIPCRGPDFSWEKIWEVKNKVRSF